MARSWKSSARSRQNCLHLQKSVAQRRLYSSRWRWCRCSAQDEYGHSIQGDFEAQADAAANLIKQAGYVDSTPAAALQEAEDALATWNDTDDSPAVQYAANRRLYNAVDTLYASLNNKVDDSTQRALDDQYNAFVSAQATIERAANVYNLWVEDYEKTVSQFPANLISGLWGAQAPERFATK